MGKGIDSLEDLSLWMTRKLNPRAEW